MKSLNTQETKKEFINSIFNWLQNTLATNGHAEYADMFQVENSSIMCDLPQNFFSNFEIPEGTKIEMKFIAKKG